MTFWRFDFGTWKPGVEKSRLTVRDLIQLDSCHEGCYVLTVGPFYLTWLAGDCYTKKDEATDE